MYVKNRTNNISFKIKKIISNVNWLVYSLILCKKIEDLLQHNYDQGQRNVPGIKDCVYLLTLCKTTVSCGN